MPTYTIEGKRIKTDAPLSDADIDEIASGLRGKASAAPAASAAPRVKPSMADAWGDVWSGEAGMSHPDVSGSLAMGVTDPVVAIRELTGTISPEAVRQREAEQRAREERVGGLAGFGRFAGGAAATAPLMASPGAGPGANLLARTAIGAGTGAVVAPLTMPTTGEGNFWEQKADQAMMGGLIGGALPLAGYGLQKLGQGWGAVRNMLSPETRAQSTLFGMADNDANRIAALKAATAAQPDLLASQAVAALPGSNAPLQTTLRRAELQSPDVIDAIRGKQTERHLDTLRRLAGGATQTEANAAAASTKSTVSGVTAPMREDALAAVQRRAEIVQEAKKTGRQLLMAPEYPGANLETPKPLDVSALIRKVEGMADSPDARVDSVQSGVLKRVADLIRAEMERGDGVMDVRALYGLRKSAINTEVQRLMPNADAKAQNKRAAELLSALKPSIDKAITEAGGAGWAQYLKTFESGMNAVSQQDLAAHALKLYESSPTEFISLVRGNNPDAVESIFGAGVRDIREALGLKFNKFQKIADDLATEARITEQALNGVSRASEVFADNLAGARIPNMLSPKITLINTALAGLEGKVNAKTMRVLTKAAQSGANINELLNFVPPGERSIVKKAFQAVNAASGNPYTINMLTPASSRENSNAMAGQ